MRAILAVCLLLTLGPAFAADPSTKKELPPHAVMEFPKVRGSWGMTLEMTTVGGANYELRVFLDGDKTIGYRARTQQAMIHANWMSDPSWKEGVIRIYGVRTREGKADAVKSLTLTNRHIKGNKLMPRLRAVRGVKVENVDQDGSAPPAPDRERPPAGPSLGAESFVEYDFSTLPPPAKGVYWRFTLTTSFKGRKEPIRDEFEIISKGVEDGGMCGLLARSMNENGFKAERVRKTKLRIYGGVWSDRFHPATTGKVESPDLRKEQLPKVTNAAKKI